MNIEEARQLILHEAYSEESLPVCVRVGNDPAAERIQKLLTALRVVFDGLDGQVAIERKLASALHALTAYVFIPVATGTRSNSWREDFVEREVIRLEMAIESIFEGIWVEAFG